MTTTDAVSRAKALFKSKFGADAEVGGAAPGRVNLIGEHTDYCDGFVFPLALQFSTVVLGRKNPAHADTVVVCSEAQNQETAEFAISDGMKAGEPAWTNYVRGMVSIYRENGFDVPGFDAVVCTDVPIGGGVSSSAALEMSTGIFIEELCKKTVEKETRALWGQKCEHTFVGLMCGIMDQMISSKATLGHALLIDCRSLECEEVPLTDPGVSVVVCNSNVKHTLTGSEYPDRVRQCKAVASAIGVKALRDATMDSLNSVKDKLSDVEYRRGRHVITEDNRVLECKDALISKDYPNAGALMTASHASLRDDYEVSIPEIDFLVELANSFPGVFGSRITGGGFGGCTVTLVKTENANALMEKMSQDYYAKYAVNVSSFITTPGSGAHPVDIS
mmetsp:Transcript_9384/g.40716  ORF Transcript_9384/g.40716 Transcript_9384/m.40716 type:complete len:390 (-) Transcript_9384:676-1845(-)